MSKYRNKKLEKYRFIEELGKGGYGSVDRVSDSSGRREYALKILNKNAIQELFEREAKILQQLNHSNIIQIYDASFTVEDGEDPYILMQCMKHGSLNSYCKSHTVTLFEKLLLIKDAALGLQCAHNNGIVHRDIKPCNILVHDEGNGPYACLADFGIAKEVEEETGSKTAAGAGSMYYLAQELLKGEEKKTFVTDIYSLGMSMYEILTGRNAYDTSSPVAFFQSLGKGAVMPPSTYDDMIPKEIDEICLKSIAQKQDRYQSMDELIIDLEEAILRIESENKEKSSEDTKRNLEKYYSLVKELGIGKIDYLWSFGHSFESFKPGKDGELISRHRVPDVYSRYPHRGEMNNKGVLWARGLWCEKNYERARECFNYFWKSAIGDAYNIEENYYLINSKYFFGELYDEISLLDKFYDAFISGHPEGINNWALYLLVENKCFSENKKESAEYHFQKAINEGSSEALYNLAVSYLKKDLVEVDFNEVKKLLEDAVDSGVPEAMRALGFLTLNDNSEENKNYSKSLNYFKQACEYGLIEAMYELGVLYKHGILGDIDYNTAKIYFEKAAKFNHTKSMLCLASMSIEKKEPIDRSIYLYKQAAWQGSDEALYQLGNFYTSDSSTKSKLVALEYYLDAAIKGHEKAVFRLTDILFLDRIENTTVYMGRLFKLSYKGVDLNKVNNFVREVTNYNTYPWVRHNTSYVDFRKIQLEKISNENDQAKFSLEKKDKPKKTMRRRRRRRRRDEEVSIIEESPRERMIRELFENKSHLKRYWYDEAAKAGYTKAIFYLGKFYSDDFYQEQNSEKAIFCYQEAAANGNTDAMSELGKCYEHGTHGLEKDLEKAQEYYQKAQETTLDSV